MRFIFGNLGRGGRRLGKYLFYIDPQIKDEDKFSGAKSDIPLDGRSAIPA
jgi:hypothetical protein